MPESHSSVEQRDNATIPVLVEPSDEDIANADTVSVLFITSRIDYLKAQNDECGCGGLVTRCDECYKREFAIGELEQCL